MAKRTLSSASASLSWLRLLMMAVLLTVSTGAVFAQAQKKISLKVSNTPLPQVLTKIEDLSGCKVSFTYDEVQQYRVSVNVKNQPVSTVMEQVLKDTPMDYTVKGKFITVYKGNRPFRSNSSVDQTSATRTVKGVVRDADGEPLVGATIRVVGKSILGVTKSDGSFAINGITDNDRLEVSFVGMKTMTVDAQNGVVVVMKDDNMIDDVVVTGIFRKARESYTGAVSTITNDQLDLYRGQNMLQTLKNIDASLNFPVNNLVGSDPNVLPNLNIRGSSSLPMSVEEFNTNASQTVNTPLIILDGFEISLTKLMDYNDEQIESINILKDAAATAIYGSRGANGVIVVITKTPNKGKLRVTAKGGVTLELPDLSSYHLLNARQKLELENLAGLYDSSTPQRYYYYQTFYNKRLKAVTDGTDIGWMSKPLRNGLGQRYNVQFDGGSEEFRWGASLAYNGVEGAMKGSSRRTLSGDATLIYSVKNLTFRNYTNIASNKANESKYGSFQNFVDMEPYDNPYDEDGNIVKDFDSFASTSSRKGNPLYNGTLNTFNKSEYLDVVNNFSVEWLITEGLRLRGQIGVSSHRNTRDIFLPPNHSTFAGSEYQTVDGVLRKGRYTYGDGTSNLINGNVTMSWSRLFADKHQIYLGANYSISEQTTKSKQFIAEGFTNENLNDIGNALQYMQNTTPASSEYTVRMVGFTGNANYTYDNRYYLDLSYRVDGNSKFGSKKRFAPFWSAGIGWNIHREHFMEDVHFISNLRLKASYGVTGSQDFTTQSVYTTYRYPSGDSYMAWNAAHIISLGNENLTWQKTHELNLGMEVGILDNRITGEVNYYSKKTNNLLSAMDLPLSAGFSSYTANVGEMKNNGVEASLNVYLIRDHKRKINWTVGGQLVYNWNEISKLSDAIVRQNELYLEQDVDISNLFYVGRPMNAIYAVRSKGIDPSTGNEVFYDKSGKLTNTWNASDKVYLGSSQPLYRGNFHTMLMWKNFTVNLSFAYHWDGKYYNTTLRNRVEVGALTIQTKNVDERVLEERWLNPGDVKFFKKLGNLDTRATSRYVFNDRLLTLQSASIQYRWNSEWLHRQTKLESVVFGINSSDLFYWWSVRNERGTNYPYARNIQGTVTITL